MFYSICRVDIDVDDNDGDLHGVKEEEHDEEGDGGAEGEAHRLYAVQRRHAVLSPEKEIYIYIYAVDF